MPFFILAGATLLGSGISALGSSSAANTAAGAQEQAIQEQMQMFQQVQKEEQPFIQGGGNALQSYLQALGIGPGGGGFGTGPLSAPFNPSNLAQTPGYQFTLGQGEQAILDNATATGGVGGGNTRKALTGYATGLADQTFQQQLQDYMAQQAQGSNQLQNLITGGANAAANLGSQSTQVGANIAGNIGNIGAYNAAGTLGATNALSGGLNSIASTYLLSNFLGGGGGGALPMQTAAGVGFGIGGGP